MGAGRLRLIPVVAVAGLMCVVSACAHVAPSPRLSASPVPTVNMRPASPPSSPVTVSVRSMTSPTTSVVLRHERLCTVRDLAAKETGGGSVASQPFSLITVTNMSHHACTLRGYPHVAAAWAGTIPGSPAPIISAHREPIAITNGSLYEVTDPGPSLFSVAPDTFAWFAVGSVTALDPPLVTFTRLIFSPANPTSLCRTGINLQVALGATASRGHPFGLTVTAFAPGRPPHN